MIEHIDTLIKDTYHKLNEKPLMVYEVFKDYFDEDRVDFQSNLTLSEFESTLKSSKYSRYTSRTNIFNSFIFLSYDEVKQNIIKALISEGALDTYICSDVTVFKYLFPFIQYHILQQFNTQFVILVHFPEVRVTNENDKYVDIKDLYARVVVSNFGRIIGTFKLARTDYPLSHLRAGYMHSHIPSTDVPNFGFESPCLGRGPINNTILSLVNECNLDLWMLFCHELNIYVRTESLSGGPYYRLENISQEHLKKQNNIFKDTVHSRPSIWYTHSINSHLMKPFLKYIIENNIIKFIHSNNNYSLAMSHTDYIISVSNAFIYFINNKMERSEELIRIVSNLISDGILKRCIISKGHIFYKETSSRESHNYIQYNGKTTFMFKGEILRMNIHEDIHSGSTNEVLLLDINYCESLLLYILLYLNTINGTENTNSETGSYKKCVII